MTRPDSAMRRDVGAGSAAHAADPRMLLDIALRGAHAAGRELMARYGRIEGLAAKSSPTDPVSDADRAAEALLVELISTERPDDGLLGEEGAERPTRSGLRWVIDPLDGTVNYLYQLDNFAVSIAVEDAEGAVVGVVHNPASGATFHAIRGGGAYLGDLRIRANDPITLQRALVATGFSYSEQRRAAQGAFIAWLLPQVRDIRRLGSAALDLCAVAAGTVDAYVEEGVEHWDVAAGELIAREAGATVSRVSPSGYASGFLAAGPALHGALTELIDRWSADPAHLMGGSE